MHCFPVQCRIHIHVVRVFVSARVYYVRRTAGEGDSAGSQGRAWARVRARARTRARWENGVGTRLCPENGRTMRPYWIIPTSLARVERPVRISIKNFKLQACSVRARAPSVHAGPMPNASRLSRILLRIRCHAPLIDAPSVAPRITGCLRSLGYTIVLVATSGGAISTFV